MNESESLDQLQASLSHLLKPAGQLNKLASSDAQLDQVTESLMGDHVVVADEFTELPENHLPVEKEASLSDWSTREIWASAPFRDSFRETLEKRAFEIEHVIEGVVIESLEKQAARGKYQRKRDNRVERELHEKRVRFLKRAVGAGAGVGAVHGALTGYKSARAKGDNKMKASVEAAKRAGLHGSAVAAGGAAGALLGIKGSQLIQMNEERKAKNIHKTAGAMEYAKNNAAGAGAVVGGLYGGTSTYKDSRKAGRGRVSSGIRAAAAGGAGAVAGAATGKLATSPLARAIAKSTIKSVGRSVNPFSKSS